MSPLTSVDCDIGYGAMMESMSSEEHDIENWKNYRTGAFDYDYQIRFKELSFFDKMEEFSDHLNSMKQALAENRQWNQVPFIFYEYCYSEVAEKAFHALLKDPSADLSDMAFTFKECFIKILENKDEDGEIGINAKQIHSIEFVDDTDKREAGLV